MKWVGRPAKYDNPEEMQNIINEYFKECEKSEEIPTVTGLAFSLDIDRNTLLRYENNQENDWLKNFDDSVKAEFSRTIKRAKRYIESNYENALFSNGKTVGAIFTLKNNYHWVDKQEIEQTNKTITVELED
ncbi:hypothetical protein FDB28_12655 [Clostridium botulinum]|nr:hypothetical protein [Clostridium botulinum]NFS29007.1 hypothetical protein [Clostridium botulinum]NFS52951.1 hypothetical protein [Clostridium botulinum]NFS95856.1 hypothetical protein [Clostridium botulinum]NFT16473.1 hypothetical protein [Clostridium botulinum]